MPANPFNYKKQDKFFNQHYKTVRLYDNQHNKFAIDLPK